MEGAFKRIGFRFSCQFQAPSVFPYKPRPFLIDTPVGTGLCIVHVHKPDIAVDDLKGCPFRAVMFQQVTDSIKGTLIFQPDFKAVLYLCVLNGNIMLFVLLIVFFINTEVHLTLEGADIQGVPHTFFFLTPY